jgi:uroporphyrinogen decarboxylase
MVEGGSTRTYSQVKGMLYGDPQLMHRLLDTVALAVTDYLNAQIAAGAQAIMIFDTWGGVLTPDDYRNFSLRYMQQIVDGLTREADGRRVPLILFTKGGCQWLEQMADTGADALGIDWSTDLAQARRRVGERVALQGNLDPAVLYAPHEIIRARVAGVLAAFGRGSGHVFNLGHGINPDVDPEHAGTLIDAVHELSAPYHT